MAERERAPRDQRVLEGARRDARVGNVNTVNLLLAGLKAPEGERLEVLASAFDSRAEIHDRAGSRADREATAAFFVPTWELDAIADRAVAAELRRRKAVLEKGMPQE